MASLTCKLADEYERNHSKSPFEVAPDCIPWHTPLYPLPTRKLHYYQASLYFNRVKVHEKYRVQQPLVCQPFWSPWRLKFWSWRLDL